MELEKSRTTEPYSRRFIKEFIELYKSLPSIWNTNCQEYRCFRQKTEDYDLLIKKWKEVEPKADRHFVVKKINLIRTKFRRDLKKVTHGGKPADWAFKHLKFLLVNNSEIQYSDDAIMKDYDDESDDDDNYDDDQTNEVLHDPLGVREKCNTPMTEGAKIPKLEIRKSSISQMSQYNDTTHLTENSYVDQIYDGEHNRMDRFDHMSKTWAMTLRSLPKDQCIIAEKLIGDILYSAQLNNLNIRIPIEVSRFLNKI